MAFEEVTGVRPVANLYVDFRNISKLDEAIICFQGDQAFLLCNGEEGPDTLNGRGRKFQYRHKLSELDQDETRTYQAAIACLRNDLPSQKGEPLLSLTCTFQNESSTNIARMDIAIQDLGRNLHLVASEVPAKKSPNSDKQVLLILQDKPEGQILKASNEDLLTDTQRASLRISRRPSLRSFH